MESYENPRTKGRLSRIERYLQKGLRIDAENHDGLTLLMSSVSWEDSDVCRFLLQHNPQINKTNRYGNTCLHYLSCSTPLDIVQMLIAAGADVNHANLRGTTPLMRVVSYGVDHTLHCIGLLSYLLDNGANISIEDYMGRNCAFRELDNTDILTFFLKNGISPNSADTVRDTLLIEACRFHSIDTVQCLLKYGADPNLVNQRGFSPLIIAGFLRQIDKYNVLIEYGANISYLDSSGRSADDWWRMTNDSIVAICPPVDEDGFNVHWENYLPALYFYRPQE